MLKGPETCDVFEKSNASIGAPFIGEIQIVARVAKDRGSQFDTHEGPCSRADVAPFWSRFGKPFGGDSDHRRTGVVRCRYDDLAALGQSRAGTKFGDDWTENRARLDRWQKEVSGDLEGIENAVRPISRVGVQHLRGARVGGFVDFMTRQLPVEEVGNHQKVFCDVELGRVLNAHAPKLIKRVNLHELESAMGEDLFSGQSVKCLVHETVRPRISVAKGGANEIVVSVEQYIIDAPCIDADTGDSIPKAESGESETFLDIAPQADDIPMQSASNMDRDVVETVYVVQLDAILQDLRSQDATAGCTEIDSQNNITAHEHLDKTRKEALRGLEGIGKSKR